WNDHGDGQLHAGHGEQPELQWELRRHYAIGAHADQRQRCNRERAKCFPNPQYHRWRHRFPLPGNRRQLHSNRCRASQEREFYDLWLLRSHGIQSIASEYRRCTWYQQRLQPRGYGLLLDQLYTHADEYSHTDPDLHVHQHADHYAHEHANEYTDPYTNK